MMVYARGGRGVIRFQTLTGASVIRAIDIDCGPAFVTREHLIGAVKRQTRGQKSEPPGHGIRIYADDVVSQSREDASESNLRADTIAVGSGVADNREGTSGQLSSQPAKSLR